MVRKRVQFGSACYHICSRGTNRRYILGSDEEKDRFLQTLERYQNRMKFEIFAYVLMGNHFHLLLEVQERVGIARVMQGVLLSYSMWYRRQEDYVGHVWQGRYSSRLVETERQFLENIKYIHQNPVRAGIVNKEEEYLWSSARYYLDGEDSSGLKISRYGEDGDTSRGSLGK